ncbi:sterol desaturase family protein [Microbaculum marinum]|uniref:Sterol desaturase family protein n=1 Tax=Microbaculum marinum TaxID=1764581 RepID=A0AAW9RUG3_9HYPH
MDAIDTIGEGGLRFAAFAAVFLLMAVFEWAAPRRTLTHRRSRRWFTNLAIVAIDVAAVRLLFPLAAVGVAFWAQSRGVGLFHITGTPGWLAGLIAFLALDLAIWAQHLAVHKIPLFWRFHRVHHADVDIDLTTALRFHPVEIAASMLWKMAVVAALGAPPLSVFLFEVVLNGMAMFNHANARLPDSVDRVVRLVLVTPDMHRVHHSTDVAETDSNYGFNLSIWDRMFRTYVPQPALGHEAMVIGLDDYQSEDPTRLGWSLLLPLSRQNRERGERRRRETAAGALKPPLNRN